MPNAERPIPKPISSETVPWTEFHPVPNLGIRYRHLTLASMGDDYRVGVAIEELNPGMRSNPAHYHFKEEEHVLVLEGTMTIRFGDERFAVKAGDYCCFPAGLRAGHGFINDSGAVCRYVILGENRPDDIAVYPDSNKVLVKSVGRRAIYDMAALRAYWDGEDTGLPAGQKPPTDPTGIPQTPDKPLPPIASETVEWNDEGDGGPSYGGRSRHLTYAAMGSGDYHVGVLIESPAPGKRLCPKHYHMLEEEHALILEGEVTLLLGDERIVMRPGDYVCFPAGQKIGHSFLNSGDGPCSYLMIGERNPHDICVYPDSKKLLVRALRDEWDIFDMTATRGYWDGE